MIDFPHTLFLGQIHFINQQHGEIWDEPFFIYLFYAILRKVNHTLQNLTRCTSDFLFSPKLFDTFHFCTHVGDAIYKPMTIFRINVAIYVT